ADTDIHPDDFVDLLVCRLRDADFQGNEQIEDFPGFIVPEFRITDAGSMPNECKMLMVALVGEADTPAQGTKTDLLVSLEGVITLIGILNSWRTVPGGLVQALKAFPGDLGPTMLHILLELGPESFVGGRNLPFDATGQLRGEMIASAQF